MLNKINISTERRKLIVYVVLTIVTLAVFWQVNQYNFINFDDPYFVVDNTHIRSGITPDEVCWSFSTRFFGLWHPLVWLSFIVDYQLHGLNPGGYHLTNLILHILSTLLLFWLFNRMTGAVWRSAFVAALFALHPLHVESIAWVSERKDVLSAFFWILTLCLYVYYTEKPVIRRYLLVVFSFVLALMSKPMVVTLPVMMILLDYWPLKRFESRKDNLVLWQLKEKLPFFILSAILVIITLYYRGKPYYKRFPIESRIANAPVAFMTYLEKTFWPHDLSFLYPFSDILPVWQVLGAALLITVICAAVVVMVRRLPYLFTGWMWYVITMVPAIGIIQTNQQAMADRYHYLPSIGIAVMLAWGIPSMIGNENIRKKILFPAGIAVLTILAVLTWKQCGYWRNNATLISHALQVTKDIDIEYISSDLALLAEGKSEEDIDRYNKAVLNTKNSAGFYNNRGNAYAKLDLYQSAIDNYSKAISLKPDFAEIYYNRGTAYGECGQFKQAIEDFDRAISLKPDYVDSYYNRGTVYAKLDQYQRAIEDFNKAISLKPDYAGAYFSRGFAYLLQGNSKDGCRDAQKVCAMGNCQLLELARSQGLCR